MFCECGIEERREWRSRKGARPPQYSREHRPPARSNDGGPNDGHRYSADEVQLQPMSTERIVELEGQLSTANASIVALTATNLELTRSLADADCRNKRLKRSARRDESVLKDQLLAAQTRRG